jgi:hypothetical protein
VLTSYTRRLECVQVKEGPEQEVYVTFSPRFERIWLELKKRLPDYMEQEPGNSRLRSQYALRLYGWAKKYVEDGAKTVSLEELRKVFDDLSAENFFPFVETVTRTSLGTLPGEDAYFDQLYSLQRIELTDTLRKNHGKNESWQLLIRLKMAGLVPAKKSSSGGRYAIILPTGVNVTTAKEFYPIEREIPHSVPTSLSPN